MKTVLEPTDGFGLIVATFKNKLYVVLYIIWIVALWFHLSHGFWSAMQTVGVNGKVWFNRWKIIGNVVHQVCAVLHHTVLRYKQSNMNF